MDITEFLKLFHPLPGNRYMQVTTKIDATTFALQKMIQEVGGEFHLVVYAQEKFMLPQELHNVRVEFVNNLANPFRALPRDHDSVILKDIVSQHANPELLLRIAYTTLANTADIVVMEPSGSCNTQELKEQLERLEFRAPNEIDLLEEYDLVVAKKMHMWGNGL
jgi:hypothetical protein